MGRKRQRIPQRVRIAVWNVAFTQSVRIGECWCCSDPIPIESFDAGHIQAQGLGGSDDVSNMRPVCRGCNSSMQQTNMRDFALRYFRSLNPRILREKEVPEPTAAVAEQLAVAARKNL